MAFLYEPKNSNLAKLVIRLQREDIEAVTPTNEDVDLALNLQLQELNIAETLIADHDCLAGPQADHSACRSLVTNSDLIRLGDACFC